MDGRWMRVAAVALGVAAFAASDRASSAQPAVSTVRGRVEIGIPATARRPSAAYTGRSVALPPLAPASEARHVVVFIKNAPSRPLPPVRTEIVQRNETFVPHVIAVPVGSTVAFPNADPIFHNVFSLSRPKTFNLGRYPRGESEDVRFDKPGIVRVFCDIHSHMSATVIVFDHPWFAIPDDQGRFELRDVPAGEREITAWHERLGDTTHRIRVETGRLTAADFTLPVPPR